MVSAMIYAFWISLAVLVYTYAGYFVLMAFLARLFAARQETDGTVRTVTVIIAAYNEERNIVAKLENVLALDYPAGKLDVLVGSDASDDGTDDLVAAFPDAGVRLVRVNGRLGKTAVQNTCAEVATGEILVFTDATTVLYPDSLKRLVSYFADPAVGCVGARLIYRSETDGQTERGGVAYWNYEARLKQYESDVNSLIGVSGCYYAVRRDRYRAIEPELISDFVVALDTVAAGYRVRYAADAVCEEETLVTADAEYSMRIRVIVRSLTALFARWRLLLPVPHPFFALQLWSHKVLRYMVWLPLLIVLCSSLWLAGPNIYGVAFVGQLVFYGCAAAGFVLTRSGVSAGLLAMPYYFCLANAAALGAFLRFLVGDRITVWSPQR